MCGEQQEDAQLHGNSLRKSGQRNNPSSTFNFYSSRTEYMDVLNTSICFTLNKAHAEL